MFTKKGHSISRERGRSTSVSSIKGVLITPIPKISSTCKPVIALTWVNLHSKDISHLIIYTISREILLQVFGS